MANVSLKGRPERKAFGWTTISLQAPPMDFMRLEIPEISWTIALSIMETKGLTRKQQQRHTQSPSECEKSRQSGGHRSEHRPNGAAWWLSFFVFYFEEDTEKSKRWKSENCETSKKMLSDMFLRIVSLFDRSSVDIWGLGSGYLLSIPYYVLPQTKLKDEQRSAWRISWYVAAVWLLSLALRTERMMKDMLKRRLKCLSFSSA